MAQRQARLAGVIPRGLRCCVTGADGFIGARLSRLLSSHGAQVSGLHRGGTLQRLTPQPDLTTQRIDLSDANDLCTALRELSPEYIFHCAGLVDWRQDPTLTPKMLQQNTINTANVLEAARLSGVRRVVIFGSAGEYGAQPSPLAEIMRPLPLDPYSASKFAATELGLLYHRSFGLSCSIVRPFMVYGPGESARRLLPSLFARALSGGGELPCSPGEQQRDFIFVDDVAEGALRAALCEEAAGQIINLGTGQATSVRDAILLACEVSGRNVRPLFGAMPYRPGEPMQMYANTERSHGLLGWSPSVSLQEGLTKMWQDVRLYYRR